jgi:molybdopterin adenylyltransferase
MVRFPLRWEAADGARLFSKAMGALCGIRQLAAASASAGQGSNESSRMADEAKRPARIGVVTISDRASIGVYDDRSGPAIVAYLTRILTTPFDIVRRIIPDGFESVRDELIDLADAAKCDLVLTTGGTGPAPRDLTPEATEAAAPRVLPGFGELMRQQSLKQVPTAILSRQIAAHRGPCLVINLPGKPASIETCLDAVFPAVPYCLDLIGAAWLDTDPAILKSFRPKQAAI